MIRQPGPKPGVIRPAVQGPAVTIGAPECPPLCKTRWLTRADAWWCSQSGNAPALSVRARSGEHGIWPRGRKPGVRVSFDLTSGMVQRDDQGADRFPAASVFEMLAEFLILPRRPRSEVSQRPPWALR